MQNQLNVKKLLEDINYYEGMIEEFSAEGRNISKELDEANNQLNKYNEVNLGLKKPAIAVTMALGFSVILGGLAGYFGNLTIAFTCLLTGLISLGIDIAYLYTNNKVKSLFKTVRAIKQKKEKNLQNINEYSQKKKDVLKKVNIYNSRNNFENKYLSNQNQNTIEEDIELGNN